MAQPVDGHLTFQYTGNKKVALSNYEFVNALGQKVLKGEFNSKSNINIVPIDLPAGVYHALVTLSNQEQIIRPFVVN